MNTITYLKIRESRENLVLKIVYFNLSGLSLRNAPQDLDFPVVNTPF
jgi:hypothetical protein